MRGDTEDEGIEHDAEEDELEVDEEDGVDGEEGEGGGGRRKQSSRSRLCKSGVARQLVTHCRFKPSFSSSSNHKTKIKILILILKSFFMIKIMTALKIMIIMALYHPGTTLPYPPRQKPTTERCAELL